MDPGERLEIDQRFFPLQFFAEITKRFLLPLPQDWKRFDNPIAKRGEKIRGLLTHSSENVPGEIAVVSSLFDDDKIIRPAKSLPHLSELRREQPAKKWTDADIRNIIASPSKRTAS